LSLEYSLETERILISKVKAGDADAFMELASYYLPFIREKAAGFSMLEAEDLCQEGLLGLLNAAKTYCSEHRASFRTYAGVCISNRLLSVVRTVAASKQIPSQYMVSLNDEKNCGIQNITSQNVSNPETLIIERENFETVRKQVRKMLTKLEQDVFFLYLSGYSYSEITERLHLSGKTAGNALQRVRQKMKRLF